MGKLKCPFGGDESNDCADCVYGVDYHYMCGQCVEREVQHSADNSDRPVGQF